MFHKCIVILCAGLFLAACNTRISPVIVTETVALQSQTEPEICALEGTVDMLDIIANQKVDLWGQCQQLQQVDTLVLVLDALEQHFKAAEFTPSQLDALLYYLRTYSYFGQFEEVHETVWAKLDASLTLLSQQPFFMEKTESARRLQEHYVVALYRFYYQAPFHTKLAPHLNNLALLLASYDDATLSGGSQQAQYSAWETLRAISFLAYEGRLNGEVAAQFNANTRLTRALTDFAMQLTQADWRFEHALWSLAYVHILMEEDAANQLDEQVWQWLSQAEFLSHQQAQSHYSLNYLANSYRAQDNCDNEFKGRCFIPSLEQALPIKHQCDDSLFILAEQMTTVQLEESCVQLLSQQADFHQILATNNQPVANDHNQSLRVVIFDDYSSYNRYGQMTFNIQTNNGGMYIEGNPSDPDNQATFYSFEAFWLRPQLSVWNLNHEYVHYLDGRFSKYGGFGHFPDKLVWWSEGMGEYISKREENPRAFKLLHETKRDNWLSLRAIFDTQYGDGSEQIYQWSYLAVRFLSEHSPTELQSLSQYLKTDFFLGYEQALTRLASTQQEEFELWLQAHNERYVKPNTTINAINRKQYRYLYRSYLQPAHLTNTIKHRHNL
ncbi:collagenase [Pseudoalteromonas ulvae]|uniref:Microbial collagenase n=1 Tax=Pseudoalteromonas ulvae TaxID=107327 RepID=A0A244CLN1_PSEDV|nr:collagenase [Pseudoalteromonas ulvae]OUL56448.1 hypothetical protein B1199_17445 [Pseudoalteromonas ulvae]